MNLWSGRQEVVTRESKITDEGEGPDNQTRHWGKKTGRFRRGNKLGLVKTRLEQTDGLRVFTTRG